MERLTIHTWFKETEKSINEALNEILERDWDENDATRSWLKAIRRRFRQVEIIDVGRPYAMAWDILRLKGKSENRYGDVGVFVRLDYPNGARTEGIGFIEAKRIYPSGRYQELKTEQLERMLKATPHHRLCLYERTPIPEATFGLAGHSVWPLLNSRFLPGVWDSVIAAVVPTSVALQMRGNRRIDLHPPALPLSFQLCARYLGGYDLDHSPKLTERARNGGFGAPEYLIVANVAIGGETSPSTDNLLRLGPEGPYDTMEPDQKVEFAETELIGKRREKEKPQQAQISA